jgi:transcriptional regulator with XRE-family HTH domain
MRLKDYIDEHELSYSSLGKTVGVSSEAIRRYANGERIPRPGVMQKISRATSGMVTPADFYDLKPKRPTKKPH